MDDKSGDGDADEVRWYHGSMVSQEELDQDVADQYMLTSLV